MSHRRRRVSRVLFGLLGLTIAVGLFTYVHKLNSSRAATPPPSPARPARPAPPSPPPARPAPAGAPLPAPPPPPRRVPPHPSAPPAAPAPAGNAATVLADARAKMQAGNLLEARDLVNG